MSMNLSLEGASTTRRVLATGIDLSLCVLLCVAPLLLAGIEHPVLTVPPDRFWPDHLLELMAHNPMVLLRLPLWLLCVGCFWHFIWLYFLDGRTLGMRALGLKAVNRYGDPLSSTECLVRVVGHLLSALGLGLGWLWVLVSADRRSWSDLLSRSYIVRY